MSDVSIARIDAAVLDRLRAQLVCEGRSLAAALGTAATDLDDDLVEAAELDALRYQKEMTAAVASAARASSARVQAALDRIADGSYGSCLACGGSIPVERLEVMPAASHCVSCQASLE